MYDVFGSGDEVDDRDDNDDRKSSDPSTKTNICKQILNDVICKCKYYFFFKFITEVLIGMRGIIYVTKG